MSTQFQGVCGAEKGKGKEESNFADIQTDDSTIGAEGCALRQER